MKKALVTGGTKGIGLSITQALLEQGFFVISVYAADVCNADKTADELSQKYHGQFAFLRQPLETEADIRSFHDSCNNMQGLLEGGLDVIVLNAGCTDRTGWADMSWGQWMHVMDVNINAPAALLRSLDTYLNEYASVVFISSDMSVYPHATSVPYTVSKAAVNGLTKALVKEYAERRIRVNAILPGFVETPWQKEKPADQKKRICDKVALHRFASPDEIADVVADVVCSTYINGALIQVDGGYCYR